MSTSKETAISFLQNAATGKLDEAYSKTSPTFRHHNPHFKGDAESLKAGMAEAHKKFPDTSIEVKRVFEAGDLVAVHSARRACAEPARDCGRAHLSL